ncbi:GtrA family protein [Alkalibacterium iburiense]|uniref:GtrA family protein n=1 Tax=Alkalibacterium iburiense TaxID=290589 RepID=A0ABN0XGV5_9LACT
MKKIYQKFKQFIDYFLYGILTTVISIGLFTILHEVAGLYYLLSNAIAIAAAILFSYVVNKKFVFKTHLSTKKASFQEFSYFVVSRLTSAGLDMLLLFLFVRFIQLNATVSKVFVEVFIASTNYLVSKWFIFKKED